MKKILLLFLSCFSCTIAEAQTTPPLFQGSDDVQLFRQALMERVTEVYYSDGYTPDDLIHYFWMNFTIDTLGRCIDLEIPDTCRRQTIIVKDGHWSCFARRWPESILFSPRRKGAKKFLTDRRWNTILPISLK